MRVQACCLIAAVFLSVGCSSEEPAAGADVAWVGSITSEGDVTTVINESGSVWGGTATLVEEASIGVEVGEEPYMLGSINSITATADRIYLLEFRPAVLRVYDMAGKYLFDIGKQGQGPGEIDNPMSAVVDNNGRLLVRDAGNHRMTVFSADGELLDTWPLPGTFSTSMESVVTPDGTVYSPESVGRDPVTRRSRVGLTPYDAAGNAGETVPPPEIDFQGGRFPPIEQRSEGGGRRITTLQIPFHPQPVSVASPVGAWVTGIGSAYRFEIRYFDGRVTVVERRVAPVPVSADEAAWQRQRTTESARRYDPEWSWSGPDVADHKPYFTGLFADQDGRVWVSRQGPSTYYEDCPRSPSAPPPSDPQPSPCWRGEQIHDLFDSDGRYLGDVEFPAGYRPGGFIRGDMLLLEGQDEAGTIVVKRFRLVAPVTGEAGAGSPPPEAG